MSFTPDKSRSLKRGKVVASLIQQKCISYTHHIGAACESLGKVFNSSLRDTEFFQTACAEIHKCLKAVDKSDLLGSFKARMCQHVVIPNILWPPLLFKVPQQ